MLTIYLAGSINGHNDPAAFADWREVATNRLEAAGYKVLNPLRGRNLQNLTGENTIEVVERDLMDIDRADLLLVEMDHPNMAYIGTSMEIRTAWERAKPIIVWGRANKGSHWIKYHATIRPDTLEEALDFLTAKKTVLEAAK